MSWYKHPRQALFHLVGPSSDISELLEYDYDEDEDLESFLNIAIVNQILEDFSKAHSMDNLIKVVDKEKERVEFKYTHNKLTYSGTVKRTLFLEADGTRTPRYQIRISSNGFRYPEPKKEHLQNYIPSRGKKGWAVMKEKFLADNIPEVVNLATKNNLSVIFLYNARLHRIDIHFYDLVTKSKKILLALKAGNPDSIEKEEYFAYFGLNKGARHTLA